MKRYLFLFILILSNSPLFGAPIELSIRVLAKDAKFIGSSMQGAEVTVTDISTGKTLAKGLTEGGTGNTKIIMKSAHNRGDVLSSKESASFNTTLNISQPTKVKISARGPMNLGENSMTTTVELWLIPGKHMNQKDAIMLELPGFYIKSQLNETKTPNTASVTSEIRMMCGCPIEPEGLWDANNYEITAYLLKNGKEISRKPMKFEKTSFFSADFNLTGPGKYEIVTFAYDSATSNTGVDTLQLNK
ncbi:hypothetical protein [Pleionea sediminis]|uniref:hypothetical protein n=1 Tax=Pleionea sediminis TaxID=2569479 RepID=UPI001186722C|nr:hypothetical protein [Pleionea sediminis]